VAGWLGVRRIPNIVASAGLVQGLAELGYVDGNNIHLPMRCTVPTPGDMKAAILALLPEIDLLVAVGA
jgi:hypothetical protein